LAGSAIRSAIREVHGHQGETLLDALNASAGYLRNALIDLETGAPKTTAVRTIRGGLARVESALAAAAREGGDVQQAPAESPQSGGEAVTPTTPIQTD
jgi:hypothetical protein